MKIILAVIILLVQGCSIHAGLALQSTYAEYPDNKMSTGLAIIRAEHYFESTKINGFCSHTSGIFSKETGKGLNMCGGMVKIW